MEGENTRKLSQALRRVVLGPSVILAVILVPSKLVGLTETWRKSEVLSKPLRKMRMTGLADLGMGARVLA